MHGAAFALAFFSGAGLFVRFWILCRSSCIFMFVKTLVTTATLALLEVRAWGSCHLCP
jgi:hypothetical protein